MIKVYIVINAMKNRSYPDLMQKVKSSNGSSPIPFLCLSKLLELNFPSSCNTAISVAEILKMNVAVDSISVESLMDPLNLVQSENMKCAS